MPDVQSNVHQQLGSRGLRAWHLGRGRSCLKRSTPRICSLVRASEISNMLVVGSIDDLYSRCWEPEGSLVHGLTGLPLRLWVTSNS